MFKGQGQTILEPSVLSTLYILIPWLLALYRFCFYREDKREFCTKGGIKKNKNIVKHTKKAQIFLSFVWLKILILQIIQTFFFLVKEQKKLREEVNRLNGALAVAQKVTAVEGSTIEVMITFMLSFINAEVKIAK